MYDDDFDLLGALTSTTTEDDYAKTGTQTTNEQSSYSSPYADDYSVTGNYQGQSSYETKNDYQETESRQEDYVSSAYQIPTIVHEEEAVSLTKTKQKIYLSTRLKLVATCFAIIMMSLAFVSVWNFVSANQIKAQIAAEQTEISAIESRISGLIEEYKLISDDGYMHQQAIEAGYEDSSTGNTFYLQADTASETTTTYKLPSNWFNDVCEFFSNLFA